MYYKRLIEKKIKEKLEYSGTILIVGPKYCGKTTTASIFAESVVKLTTKQNINLANVDKSFVLDGKPPRLIDEWQTVPDIWNYVRDKVDEKQEKGLYILTGSTTPSDKTSIFHSGAGRISTIKMKPLTLTESNESKGLVSLKELFEKDVSVKVYENKNYDLMQTAFCICRGGWPNSVLAKQDKALNVTKDYFKGLFNFENSENYKFRNKKPEILKMVLASYARNISTEATYTTILDDITKNNNRSINTKTLDDYMDALKDIYILEDITAFSPNLRSKTAIRTTNTRHFVDTSIACQALNVTPQKLIKDLNTYGLFFEDFVVKELSVYADLLDGSINHYRDKNGLECDVVINLDDGRYALIEVKLGGDKLIEEGAKTLVSLSKKIDNEVSGEPAFMAIITATGALYRRKDGIYVIPINCLSF